MSILPLVSHANKGTPCWKTSGEVVDVQEAISLYRMGFETTTLSPTSLNGTFGSISANSVFNNATAVGWVWLNPFNLGTAYVVNIYLTSNEDGTPDGFGNTFTGITISSTSPTINLAGLQYANYEGVQDLYLGYTVTTPGTAGNQIVSSGQSGGTCAYNNQFTYSSWTISSLGGGAGVPVVLICE